MYNEINNKDLQVIKNYFIKNNLPKKNGIVVECGAASGGYNPSLFLEKKLDWQFIGIEPNPQFWDALNKNRSSLNALKIYKALSDVDGISEFCVAGDNSSLHHSDEHIRELIGLGRYNASNKIIVNTMKWETFLLEYNISSVDLLILDVEGCELSVLNGMINSIILPDIMIVEYPRSDYTFKLKNPITKEDFSGFKIIKDKLYDLGYLFDYVQDANAFFSKKSFWNDRERPEKWYGEDNIYVLTGFIRYDKEKCKNI